MEIAQQIIYVPIFDTHGKVMGILQATIKLDSTSHTEQVGDDDDVVVITKDLADIIPDQITSGTLLI